MENSEAIFQGIVGNSPAMRLLFDEMEQIAPIEIPVIIYGESGTGKELVARAVHALSRRREGPFIPVNTGAIATELVASELFGHEKGAFTGASSMQPGHFDAAAGGSLFLDEIGTMDEATQVTLLRVLETGRYQRLGGSKFLESDVRIIAATNADLRISIKNGEFREDLFHRFNVFPLRIPPLRERPEDIPALLDYFSAKYCGEFSLDPPRFSRKAIELLKLSSWTGNVREFENTVMRLLITNQSRLIRPGDLPERIQRESGDRGGQPAVEVPVGSTLAESEALLIRATLSACRGNKKRTAETLGISRKALYGKLEKYGIS